VGEGAKQIEKKEKIVQNGVLIEKRGRVRADPGDKKLPWGQPLVRKREEEELFRDQTELIVNRVNLWGLRRASSIKGRRQDCQNQNEVVIHRKNKTMAR